MEIVYEEAALNKYMEKAPLLKVAVMHFRYL